MKLDEFRIAYLDPLKLGPEYDLYGFKPAGVLAFTDTATASAISILVMRAAKKHGEMSRKRCHNAWRSDHLWQLTTDDGARFLYFQDGPRTLIFVSATYKMKEKEFYNEIKRAERLRLEYLQIKEGKVR